MELVGWGAAEAPPLEIVDGSPLEGEGEWVRAGRDLVDLWVCVSRPVFEEVAELADGV